MAERVIQSRRDFLRNAVMLAGAGVTAMDARVKAGIEANRKGDLTLVFTDTQGRTNFDREAAGGRLSFRGFCGTYEVEATSNGRTVKREFHLAREHPVPVEISIA